MCLTGRSGELGLVCLYGILLVTGHGKRLNKSSRFVQTKVKIISISARGSGT